MAAEDIFQAVIDNWIEEYERHPDNALVQLQQFFISCCGCKGIISSVMLQTMEYRWFSCFLPLIQISDELATNIIHRQFAILHSVALVMEWKRCLNLFKLIKAYLNCSADFNCSEIIRQMTDQFDEDTGDYPLVMTGPLWKRFKQTLADFVLVKFC